MTDPNLTSVTVILDRSGSMQLIDKDTCGGFNAFVDEQKKGAGKCTLTLVRFDTEATTDYMDKPIADVPALTTVGPRSSTALYDAVCKTIDDIGSRLSGLSENLRPGRVVVVIITDGEENASRRSAAEVKTRIEHQRHVYNWQFVFLGANQDAMLAAKSMGVSLANAANYAGDRVHNAFAQTSGVLRGFRGADVGASLQAYSALARADMMGVQEAKTDPGVVDTQPVLSTQGVVDAQPSLGASGVLGVVDTQPRLVVTRAGLARVAGLAVEPEAKATV